MANPRKPSAKDSAPSPTPAGKAGDAATAKESAPSKKRVWDYIRKNDLQDKAKRSIK
jgi:hypothetical protein